MKKNLKESYTPLFNMDNKELIRFAYRTQNKLVMDTVAPEMMRRMITATKEFNKQSSRQTEKMIKLTYWIIGLTVVLGVLASLQVVLLFR